MPLNLAALTTSPGLPGAAGRDYPPTAAECAAEWAAAIEAWAVAVVPPSSTVAAARAALEATLASTFTAGATMPALDAALATFAATVALGMLPAFTASPPPGPVGFAAALAGPAPATRAEGVSRVANAIHAWGLTGVAVPVAPPNTPVTWT